MLGLLEGIEEYNNQGALLGLEGVAAGRLPGIAICCRWLAMAGVVAGIR